MLGRLNKQRSKRKRAMGVEAPQTAKVESLLSKGIGSRGQYSKAEVNKLAQEISDLTGYDLVTVRSFLRNKAFQSGDLKTLNIIRSLLLKQGEAKPVQQQVLTPQAAPAKSNTGDVDLLLHQIFNIKNDIQQQKTQLFNAARSPLPGQVKADNQRFASLLSGNVTSPRQFASLLVNNKATFILLKSNPVALPFILTMTNPNVSNNPVFFNAISAFVANMMKLKQAKPTRTEEDDQIEHDREQEAHLDEIERKSSVVSQLKEVSSGSRAGKLKDFLLEAERFAEEEIANLWSISLKKEKQLEQLVRNLPDDIKHMVERSPHLNPRQVLDKIKEIQGKKK